MPAKTDDAKTKTDTEANATAEPAWTTYDKDTMKSVSVDGLGRTLTMEIPSTMNVTIINKNETEILWGVSDEMLDKRNYSACEVSLKDNPLTSGVKTLEKVVRAIPTWNNSVKLGALSQKKGMNYLTLTGSVTADGTSKWNALFMAMPKKDFVTVSYQAEGEMDDTYRSRIADIGKTCEHLALTLRIK
jgi:hypothetical protein